MGLREWCELRVLAFALFLFCAGSRSLVASNSVNVERTEAKEGLCLKGMPMPKEVPRKRIVFPAANPSNRVWGFGPSRIIISSFDRQAVMEGYFSLSCENWCTIALPPPICWRQGSKRLLPFAEIQWQGLCCKCLLLLQISYRAERRASEESAGPSDETVFLWLTTVFVGKTAG